MNFGQLCRLIDSRIKISCHEAGWHFLTSSNQSFVISVDLCVASCVKLPFDNFIHNQLLLVIFLPLC